MIEMKSATKVPGNEGVPIVESLKVHYQNKEKSQKRN